MSTRATVDHGKDRTRKLTGFEAIDYAEHAGLPLNQSADSDPTAHRLSIAEAEAIVTEDPQRVWIIVPAENSRAAQ